MGTGRLDTRGHFPAAWNGGPASRAQRSGPSVLSDASEGSEGSHPCGPSAGDGVAFLGGSEAGERKPGRAPFGRGLFPEILSAALGSRL